ncbi:MAG TPA: D-alanyl-D-alanine carboxypeptidase [Candidatus Mediterraneibacter excrementipullorum]|nr:D-alanyl-D-alanine carboxypeptidase [Candidatus Mediterraneibacter excrementipullorum]
MSRMAIKRIQALLLGAVLTLSCICFPLEILADEEESKQAEETGQAEIDISAPSAVLMEASTGTVIYEKDADTARPPASVTKVMTMLLIFDALEAGSIHLEDEVTTSEYAASMGGSQVFLEPGEIQTVDTMLKCIAVASANDACVAMAEYICGSEEEFVRKMNERAKGLGMDNTNFVNCNGLDAEGHVTSARDIALMSRELIAKYPQIHDYSMIWMENITHNTSKGTSEFGLTNTNKLVRQYEYATGLKTGSTGEAKFCVSATGEKNGIEMIAVVMGAETSKERFADAVKLLNHGFGKCQLYTDESAPDVKNADVEGGVREYVSVERPGAFSYLDMTGANLAEVEKRTEMNENLSAPLKKGDVIGYIVYSIDGREIGRAELTAGEAVEKAGFIDYLIKSIDMISL